MLCLLRIITDSVSQCTALVQVLGNNHLICQITLSTFVERFSDHKLNMPHTHTHTHNHFTALWILSTTTQMSWYQKKHSPTHICHGHQWSLICFLHLLWSMASSLFNLRAWQSFPQSLSKFSFVYLLAWHLQLHTPYIYSPNHCLLFAAHIHTIATCFAVILRLWHIIPSLSQPFTWDSYLVA